MDSQVDVDERLDDAPPDAEAARHTVELDDGRSGW
jgi:hypothetical protein